MNQYETEFVSACPVNGKPINYRLTIQANEVIMVEEIIKEISKHTSGLHEQIADALRESLGGSHTLRANHHGVTITTYRL